MHAEGENCRTYYEVILYANVLNAETGTVMDGNVDGALGYWIGYGVADPVHIMLEDPGVKEQ